MGDDEIHALANITVLNERTNVKKLADKKPWQYIQQFHISEQTLRKHLIPEHCPGAGDDVSHLKERWDVKRYTDFLIERAQLLAKVANDFMMNLDTDSYPLRSG